MTATDFNQILNILQEAQPFRTFTVALQGGQKFTVDRPNAFVFRSGVAVYLAPGGYPIRFDYTNTQAID
jgi:hypothetical protein